jgi:2-polyprenyl-3-methyl-5-hydroxy-6-metoxy-1,4-benzoquinol methylase
MQNMVAVTNRVSPTTQSEKLDERRHGLYGLLFRPAIYELVQRLLGADQAWRRFVQEFVCPNAGARILDVGCGPGTLLEFLPVGLNCDYVGFDNNADYYHGM